MHFKYDHNFFLLCSFFIFQILILVCYLKFSSTWNGKIGNGVENLPEPVQFLGTKTQTEEESNGVEDYTKYYNVDDGGDLHLKSKLVQDYFQIINNMVCFKAGTDIKLTEKNNGIKGSTKCECLSGYHGNDCSLPEVIWRAFIAFGKETVIRKRKSKARRIIHMFEIRHEAQIPLALIQINELFSIVDVFIVAEYNQTKWGHAKSLDFKVHLDRGALRGKQHKIVYVPVHGPKKTTSGYPWKKSLRVLKNLNEDDLFLELESSEIPSPKALLFFKLFDGFSLPLQFRLKWNVYGYFFQHPKKTKIITTGSTIRMLEQVFKNDQGLVRSGRALVVGDLNHYGGWFCDFCHEPKHISAVIRSLGFREILPPAKQPFDVKYWEQIIGDGLYVDGKTLLLPIHQFGESFYAPEYVSTNFWQFDSLMTNFYNKNDYN